MHQQTVYHMTKILVSLYKNQLNLKGLVHAMRSNGPLHQVLKFGREIGQHLKIDRCMVEPTTKVAGIGNVIIKR